MILPLMMVLAGAAPATEPVPFEMPASLQPAVGFWARVYGEWSTRQVALHDTAEVDVVYRVLDVSAFEPAPGDTAIERTQKVAARTAAVDAAREEIENALTALDTRRPTSVRGLKGTERTVYLAWERRRGDDERFGRAAGRVRGQRGLRDRYLEGWRQAGRFMGAVQRGLADAGLPPALVALAFTESLMNVHARSVSGAVGPWQFLKGTGREYLVINEVVDERKDPVLATAAAGRYLATSKKRLGSWGAAITAYNYGMNGMARAEAQLGTDDIEVILRDYDTRQFGFAAKNYYAEFLASLHVLSHADRYFPGEKQLPPWSFDRIVLPRNTTGAELRAAGVARVQLAELNPALTPAVLAGTETLPAGLTIRVPAGTGTTIVTALAGGGEVPAVPVRTVTLQRGETLLAIARRHQVTLAALCSLNGLDPAAPVAAGTRLSIPTHTRFTPLPADDPAAPVQGQVLAAVSAVPVFAAFLARPAGSEELVVASLGSAPAIKPRGASAPVDAVLTSAVAAPPPTEGPAGVLLDESAWEVVRGPHALRTATGGAVRVAALRVLDGSLPVEDLPVDVIAGADAVPAVDVMVGAAWTDGSPLPTLELPATRGSGQPTS